MADEKVSLDPLHVVTAISDVAALAQEVTLRAEALAEKWEVAERPWTERIADLRRFAAEIRAARTRLLVGAKQPPVPGLTSAELAEMRRRVDAASPGPWEWWTSNSLRRLSGSDGKDGGVLHAVVHRDGVPDVEVRWEDMEFIARSRADFARLLDEVERLRGQVEGSRIIARTAKQPAVFSGLDERELLTPGQRAVLEAADEWERAGGLGLGTGAHTAKLIDAVRELREIPEAIRINSGKVTEEQRREFLQALKSHAGAVHPMPEGAGVPFASVRVDPGVPLGTMRFEPGGDVPSVTVTNLGPDAGLQNGPFRGEIPFESVTLFGEEALEAFGQLRGVRIESVERVGPPSPGIQRTECAVKVVQTSALDHSGEGVSYPLINPPQHQDQTVWSARKEALAVDGRLAECLFVAYNEQGPNPWKTWDGKDVPRWPALSDQVREKWRAAAMAWTPELARVLDRIRSRANYALRWAKGERVHTQTTPEEALLEIRELVDAALKPSCRCMEIGPDGRCVACGRAEVLETGR